MAASQDVSEEDDINTSSEPTNHKSRGALDLGLRRLRPACVQLYTLREIARYVCEECGLVVAAVTRLSTTGLESHNA